jgi:hypothetical protein
MMFNLHLLQKELTVEEYQQVVMPSVRYNPEWHRLPAYVIARCPFCLTHNVEKLDTYTLRRWRIRSQAVAESVFYYSLVVHHCEHFALVQSYLKFHGNLSDDDLRVGGEEVPFVIGHLLESGRCLAVMHALPICRIEDNAFVPRYTLFMVSYFSEQPKEAIRDVERYNIEWYNPVESILYLPLQFGEEKWADLRYWVSAGQLFWVDGDDPDLGLRTHDVEAFPYGDVVPDARSQLQVE